MTAAKSLELIARDSSVLRRVRERIPTYFSDFREDPRWLLMFVLGRTAIGRRLHGTTAPLAGTEDTPLSSMFGSKRSDVVSALMADGLFDGLMLPPAVTDEILQFALATGCFGNHDRALDLTPARQTERQNVANPVTSGHYFERVETCPAIMALQSDELLHAVARDYLGASAKVISTRLWWSFPALKAGSAQSAPEEMLHFDLDDWRMLKFFFYITPVDADSGPHLYMRGTHKHHVLKHQLSITVGRPMTEVMAVYGADRLMTIHGTAGSGFAEDPYGYHAGSLAQKTDRLMLEIGFGITSPNRRRFYGERVLNNS